MGATYQRPEALSDQITHYCPGCTHGVAHRLIAEVIDELHIRDRTVGIAPVGCAVLMYNYFTIDFQESAHGRAPAMATGAKRVRPDLIVFTYQGDGDLASIGTAEIIHAANRGEKITVIFSLVELISTCPTNWGVTPVEAVSWAEDNMLKYYPLGELKTPEDIKLKAIN
jgi:2-oxoglutarate ferredoxin oxidoreductase subunit beta